MSTKNTQEPVKTTADSKTENVTPGQNPDSLRKGTSTQVSLPGERTEALPADQVVSPDIDIAYPLTSPAKKQQADRWAQEAEKGSAKPYPVGSNQSEENVAPPAPVQSKEDFEQSGGVKVTDNDVAKIEENASGTTEDAKKADAKKK